MHVRAHHGMHLHLQSKLDPAWSQRMCLLTHDRIDARSAVRLVILLARKRLALGAAPGVFPGVFPPLSQHLDQSPTSSGNTSSGMAPPDQDMASTGDSTWSGAASSGAHTAAPVASTEADTGRPVLPAVQYAWRMARARAEGRAVESGVHGWPGEDEGTECDEWGPGDESQLQQVEAALLSGQYDDLPGQYNREEPNGPQDPQGSHLAPPPSDHSTTPSSEAATGSAGSVHATKARATRAVHVHGSVFVPEGLSLGEAVVADRLTSAARLRRMCRAWGPLDLGAVAAHWSAAGLPAAPCVKVTLAAQFHLQLDQPPLQPLPAAQLIGLQLVGLGGRVGAAAEVGGGAGVAGVKAKGGGVTGGSKGSSMGGTSATGGAESGAGSGPSRVGGEGEQGGGASSKEEEGKEEGNVPGERMVKWLQMYCQKVSFYCAVCCLAATACNSSPRDAVGCCLCWWHTCSANITQHCHQRKRYTRASNRPMRAFVAFALTP